MRRRDFIAGALALLLSVTGLSLAVPATAAEVNYDPGDRLYFTYCYAHPPAIRIKPGDSVITSTRDKPAAGKKRHKQVSAGLSTEIWPSAKFLG